MTYNLPILSRRMILLDVTSVYEINGLQIKLCKQQFGWFLQNLVPGFFLISYIISLVDGENADRGSVPLFLLLLPSQHCLGEYSSILVICFYYHK